MIDIDESIDIVWAALEDYRSKLIPEGRPVNDKRWDDICTAMAVITEDLGLEKPHD